MPDTLSIVSGPVDRSLIDLVYLFGPGSNCLDKELLYSLRSAFKHLQGLRNIYVMGPQPKFTEPVTKSPAVWFCQRECPDPFGDKQHNQRFKLMHAGMIEGLTDEFLLMNDDFYFLADVSARDIPYYRQGTLPMHLEWREHMGDNPYLEAMRLTDAELVRAGLPRIDFELHVPMRYNKDVLREVLDDHTFDWARRRGLLMRSLYGNFLGLEGTPLEDLKIDCPLDAAEIKRRIINRPFFSTGPGGCNADMFKVMEELFPAG